MLICSSARATADVTMFLRLRYENLECNQFTDLSNLVKRERHELVGLRCMKTPCCRRLLVSAEISGTRPRGGHGAWAVRARRA